jgi:hypothetical protein
MTAGVLPARPRLASPVTALVLGVVVALLAVALVLLAIAARHNPLTSGEGMAITVPFAAVGVLVARRQPGNVIGWLMISPAVSYLVGANAGLYAVIDYQLGRSLPFGPVALLLYQAWLPMLALFPLVILLFPDGRLSSPRWRPVLWSYIGLCCGFLALLTGEASSVILAGHIQVDSNGQLTVFDRHSGWLTDAQAPVLAAFMSFWLLFMACQVLSWRRSSGEQRQQLKWLLGGAAICLGCLTIEVTLGSYSGIWQAVSNMFAVGVLALPAGIGVAILKYRLYEIDRIISRTLAYAIVTGLLVGTYAGLVLLATQVLAFRTPVVVAGATLTVAALFNPLRQRVQRVVDRRFNRARYDADQAIAAFAARLQDPVDLDAVHADLLAAVRQALEPVHASVWIRQAVGSYDRQPSDP